MTEADTRGALEASFPETIQAGQSVCIVVSDHTRKTGVDRVFPTLMDILGKRGVSTAGITILVATGIHRHPTRAEMRGILGGAAYAQLSERIVMHDPDATGVLVDVGRSPSGHPVRINRHAAQSDHLILTGTVTYHYHAGFGGGRKSLVPGIAARDTIAHTHSLSLAPVEDRFRNGVAPGHLDGNPVSEAMTACARLCPPDMILNTVLTPDGAIAGVFCGELDAAHREACDCAARIYGVGIAAAIERLATRGVDSPTCILMPEARYTVPQRD